MPRNFSLAGDIQFSSDNTFNSILEEAPLAVENPVESDGYDSDTTTSWASLCQDSSSLVTDVQSNRFPKKASQTVDSGSDVELVDEVIKIGARPQSERSSLATEKAQPSPRKKEIMPHSNATFYEMGQALNNNIRIRNHKIGSKNYYVLISSSHSSDFKSNPRPSFIPEIEATNVHLALTPKTITSQKSNTLAPKNMTFVPSQPMQPTSTGKLLIEDLALLLKGLLHEPWFVSSTSDGLQLFKIEDNLRGVPTVKISLAISSTKVTITVLGKVLPENHNIYKARGQFFRKEIIYLQLSHVLEIINTLLTTNICEGIKAWDCNEVNVGTELSNAVMRSKSCLLITSDKCCFPCSIIRTRVLCAGVSSRITSVVPVPRSLLQNPQDTLTFVKKCSATNAVSNQDENSTLQTGVDIKRLHSDRESAMIRPPKLSRLGSETLCNPLASGAKFDSANLPKLIRFPTPGDTVRFEEERNESALRPPSSRKVLWQKKPQRVEGLAPSNCKDGKTSQRVEAVSQSTDALQPDELIPSNSKSMKTFPRTDSLPTETLQSDDYERFSRILASTELQGIAATPQTQEEKMRSLGLERVSAEQSNLRKSKRERKPTTLFGEALTMEKDVNKFLYNNLDLLVALFSENLNFGSYSYLPRPKLLKGCQKINEILKKWQKLSDANPDMFFDQNFPYPVESNAFFDDLSDSELREHLSGFISDIRLAKFKFNKTFPAFDKWYKEFKCGKQTTDEEDDDSNAIVLLH